MALSQHLESIESEEVPFDPNWKPEEHSEPVDENKESEPPPVEPEVKAENETEAKVESESKTEKPPAGYVPHGALHEERQRRRELESTVEKMEQRFAQVLDTLAKPKAETKTDETPSFEDDPVGSLRAENQKLAKALQEIQDERTKNREADTERTKTAQFANTVARQVNEFRKTTPDYDQAFQFILTSRIEELTAIGDTDEHIQQVLDAEAGYIAQTALAKGKNPGAALYEMAKKRGYQPPKPETSDKKEDATMRAVEKGQSRGTPLATGEPTLKELANMDEDEFDQAVKELGWK